MAAARSPGDARMCMDWREGSEPILPVPERAAAAHRRKEPGLVTLAQTIESEIIPRLLLTHGSAPAPLLRSDEEPVPGIEELREFARLVLSHDVSVALAYVEVLRARGHSIEHILLHLLAPTARLLGDMWMEDLCTFTDVTVGLSHLQQILRELGARSGTDLERAPHDSRLLLSTLPGEQHSFGMYMVEEFFRRSGWLVWSATPASRLDLVSLVRREWFDVVGLSASCDILFDQVASTIQALRRASLNRHVGILVGGRLFLEHPDYVARVGADASAQDGREAVLLASHLVGRKLLRS